MFIDGQQKATVTLSGAMGLNTSLAPSDISDNELSTAYNVWFDAGSGKLVTRTGIACSDANLLGNPITTLKSFVRKTGEAWIVCVSNSILYYLNAGTWTQLAPIENEYPAMESFNGTLYVADSSDQGLLTWDGTTVARLSGSPHASVVFTAKNSLICNDIQPSELDAVYISKVESDSFDTTDGASIVRAGYGDGMEVNGFSAIGDTLIISKVAKVDGKVSRKSFYKITMTGASSSWSAGYLSNNNAALSHDCIEAVAQDVLYMDDNGIESLKATQKYGDVSTDPSVGGRINSSIKYGLSISSVRRVRHIPSLSTTVFIAGSSIFLLSDLTGAFTEVDFQTPIQDIMQHGEDVYLAGDSGQLYSLSKLGTDEVVAGSPISFSSVVGFKMISASGDLLLTKTHLDLDYLNPGTYKVMCSSGERNERTVMQIVDFETATGDELLHGANYDLASATQDLGSIGTERRIACRTKYRGDGIALQVTTGKGGRLSFGRVSAQVTQVGR